MSEIVPLITPRMFSHGTVECQDMTRTRAFLQDFLGLGVHRPVPEAQYMYKGGPWTVVCVRVDDEVKDQGVENRFEIAVASPAEVDAAHAAAIRGRDEFGILEIHDVVQEDDNRSFMLKDLNNTWWEISSRTQVYYDALFAKGDIAA